ncbi:putative transposase [Rhizobium leguminosarum]|nr:putative transposase [Rhizobium leguminosarum]
MNQHLLEISQAVDEGAHAVLIVDQAGWHVTPKLKVPDNVTLLFLPPRSPELNPVENLWRWGCHIKFLWLERSAARGYSGDTGRNFPCIESFEPMVANCLRGAATGRNWKAIAGRECMETNRCNVPGDRWPCMVRSRFRNGRWLFSADY